ALQGLLQYDHHKHWRFPGGPVNRRGSVRPLEKWSAAGLRAVGRPTMTGEACDPISLLVELRTIGARMHGPTASPDPSAADFVCGLFEDWKKPEDEARRSQAWRDLASMFRQRRNEIQDMLMARILCTKGWRATAQLVDAVRLIKPLREVRASWVV